MNAIPLSNIPAQYPQYLLEIKNPCEQVMWKGKYIETYHLEYERNDQEAGANCLKAAMYGAFMLSAVAFSIIMLPTAPASIPFIVASILAVGGIGITASVCTIVNYAIKANQNSINIQHMEAKFPIKFEVEFRKAQCHCACANDFSSHQVD